MLLFGKLAAFLDLLLESYNLVKLLVLVSELTSFSGDEKIIRGAEVKLELIDRHLGRVSFLLLTHFKMISCRDYSKS